MNKAFGLMGCMVSAFFLLTLYIPLGHFLDEPNPLLGTWLIVMFAVWIMNIWVMFSDSPKALAVWAMLMVALLGMLWIDDVNLPFQIDGCLDSGGRWLYEEERCDGAGTQPEDTWKE